VRYTLHKGEHLGSQAILALQPPPYSFCSVEMESCSRDEIHILLAAWNRVLLEGMRLLDMLAYSAWHRKSVE